MSRSRPPARASSATSARAASRELGAGLFGSAHGRIEVAPPRFEVVPGADGGRVRIQLREP